jgi:quinol monooxygenase YgiN
MLRRHQPRESGAHNGKSVREAEYFAMISFTVRLRFKAEDREEIQEALRALTGASRQEPGCVTYIPHTVDGDADTVLIYEQYKDAAAADAHRASEHFKKYAVGGLYQRMLERTVENLHAIG